MKAETLRKTTRAVALILRLSGGMDARRQAAFGYARNAGMGERAAVKLVDRLATKGEAP